MLSSTLLSCGETEIFPMPFGLCFVGGEIIWKIKWRKKSEYQLLPYRPAFGSHIMRAEVSVALLHTHPLDASPATNPAPSLLFPLHPAHIFVMNLFINKPLLNYI